MSNWADVDPVALAAFMSSGLSGAHVEGGDVTSGVTLYYNTFIGKAADKFAPLRSRKIKSRAGKPLYTSDIHSARVTRRKLGRKAIWFDYWQTNL